MKLRIERGSLRIRLSQPEVEGLAKSGQLTEKLTFPNNHTLIYEICSDSTTAKTRAEFLNEMIIIRVPVEILNDWSNSKMVGFEENIDLENGEKLSILVEKDFKKLTRKDKNSQGNLFPNPKERN